MNKTRGDSLAHAVRSRVERGGADRLWTYADFPRASRAALAAALSRLVKDGRLVRVRRGVYYRPKSTLVGPSQPDREALADATLRAAGTTAMPSGIGAYNRLGLTTQVSGVVSRAASRRVRRKPSEGMPIRATERPLREQRGIRSDERTALDALRDIRHVPDAQPSDVVRRIAGLVRSNALDYVRLARFALAEPPRVRALVGAIGEDLRAEGLGRRIPVRALRALEESLNPLTRFAMPGIEDALRSGSRWRIIP